MKLLLDTNVVVDMLLQRVGYQDAEKILNLAIEQKTIECVTSTTVTDINYLVGKNSQPKLDSFMVQDRIRDILKILDVLSVSKEDIINALNLRWKDMEDALQYTIAKANGCDYIITNNIKDFALSDIEVLKPADFLSKYFDKTDIAEENSHIVEDGKSKEPTDATIYDLDAIVMLSVAETPVSEKKEKPIENNQLTEEKKEETEEEIEKQN